MANRKGVRGGVAGTCGSASGGAEAGRGADGTDEGAQLAAMRAWLRNASPGQVAAAADVIALVSGQVLQQVEDDPALRRR